MITDTERIDFLQMLLDRKVSTGKAILRESITGRGFRLHEVGKLDRRTDDYGSKSIRDAIDKFMEEYD